MKHSVIAAFALACIALTSARADLICPKESLADLRIAGVWATYQKQSGAYLRSLHPRLSNDLAMVLDARGQSAQKRAAEDLGRENAMVMEHMFEQGFIAATNIVTAYCVSVPDKEAWSAAIKEQRRQKWCRQWGEAHFYAK